MKIKNQRFLGVMIIAFFILFFALSLIFIHLQNLQYQSSVELHQGNFPDKAFRSYIMVSFDDGDKKLSNKELKILDCNNTKNTGIRNSRNECRSES